MVKKMIKRIIKHIQYKFNIYAPVRNVNKTNYEKNCLLLYITEPFELKDKSNAHQNLWQVIEIARIIGELGYNVDVLNYKTKYTLFGNKKYDLIFDICAKDKPIYRNHMAEDCKKIIYFTGSESEFANGAELQRISDLANRRGVKLLPRRQAPLIPKCVEDFDTAIMIGNEYNFSTYSMFEFKKSFLVPNTGYDFNFEFDCDKKSSKNFLFFGSGGCVHKGLDLLLEIFSEKDFPANLYVCGVFDKETDFRDAYEKELYHTENIIPVGFVNVKSDKFEELVGKCSYVIMPSCSEGMAGAITTMLSAGIVAICSKECGYEDTEVINLPDCKIDTIRQYVIDYANKPIEWIMEKSKKSEEIAQIKYSESEFTRLMTKAIRATVMSVESED